MRRDAIGRAFADGIAAGAERAAASSFTEKLRHVPHRALRILYVGNYRHPWCSEVHIARELEALGHIVFRCQERPGKDPAQVDELAENIGALRPNLVLYTRTWGLDQRALLLWARCRAEGIVTASYHLDLYRGLHREGTVSGDPFWQTQFVFTPDGDPNSQLWFEERGINHVWSPPAVVSDECVPGAYRRQLAHDVVFVGSYGYHQEWPYRRQLIDWLRATYGRRFALYGGPDHPIRGARLNDLYASAKVVVGDSLCQPGHIGYWSDRVYETVGRGGFLIHPSIEGLQYHFEDGEHLRFYEMGDFAALCELIDFYVEHQNDARRIARTGQEHVRMHHTYQDRLGDALAWIERAHV